MGPEQLADDLDVLGLVDPDEDDGQVPGDPVGPEPGCAALVPGKQGRGRPKRRVRVQDPVGEALEEVGFVGLHAQVVELDLGLRPGERRLRVRTGSLAVLVRQVQDVLP